MYLVMTCLKISKKTKQLISLSNEVVVHVGNVGTTGWRASVLARRSGNSVNILTQPGTIENISSPGPESRHSRARGEIDCIIFLPSHLSTYYLPRRAVPDSLAFLPLPPG